jgi:hypothetical protein
VDLERIITLLLWPAIGLIAWWAQSNRPEPPIRWVIIYLALGPLMLVPLAWHFVTAPTRAAGEAAPGMRAGASAVRGFGQLDGEQDVATGTNVRRRRRRHRR